MKSKTTPPLRAPLTSRLANAHNGAFLREILYERYGNSRDSTIGGTSIGSDSLPGLRAIHIHDGPGLSLIRRRRSAAIEGRRRGTQPGEGMVRNVSRSDWVRDSRSTDQCRQWSRFQPRFEPCERHEAR